MQAVKKVQLPKSAIGKIQRRVKSLFNDEQEIYEKSRKDLNVRLESVKRKKKNLMLQLLDKDTQSEGDIEMYDQVKADLDIEEYRLSSELARVENQIAGVVRTIEIALSLAANCYYAYKKASPELKGVLVRTFFKKIIIEDKKIARVVLNEPLDYLCRSKLKRYPIFEQAVYGGPSMRAVESGSERFV